MGQRLSGHWADGRRAWEHVVPFFAFAPSIRKVIYTTNAVRSAPANHQDPRRLPK
jgi:putative transposase